MWRECEINYRFLEGLLEYIYESNLEHRSVMNATTETRNSIYENTKMDDFL